MTDFTPSLYTTAAIRERSTLFAILLPIITYILYHIGLVTYNLFFHPLRKFPGPILWAGTPLPYVWYQTTGNLPFVYKRLHDQYGDVVRVLPHKLSFRSPAAWKDIYQAGAGKKFLLKDALNQSPGDEGVYNIVTAFNVGDHARYHRKLSPAFSQKALFEQEPYIMRYVDLLITKLKLRCGDGPQDMVRWSNLMFFDIMADLTFGESLHGLEEEVYHPWLEGLFEGFMKSVTLARAGRQFPHISRIWRMFNSKNLADQQVKHSKFVRERVEQRMVSKSTRCDFMSYILPYDEEKVRMNMAEVRATYGTLMLAGSENVIATVVFTLYLVLHNPTKLSKLIEEIRTSCRRPEDINFLKVSQLKYLGAVVNESMRIYPAAPTSQPRVVPEGGETISGHWVPGGTRVGVPPYCMYHSPEYFHDPEAFLPERWITENSDDKSVFWPFQLGPRACAGQPLALAEVRTVLARLLWEFDIEEVPQHDEDWGKGIKVFHLWQLKPLYCEEWAKVLEDGQNGKEVNAKRLKEWDEEWEALCSWMVDEFGDSN